MDVASGRPVKNAMITLNIDNKEFVLFIFPRGMNFSLAEMATALMSSL